VAHRLGPGELVERVRERHADLRRWALGEVALEEGAQPQARHVEAGRAHHRLHAVAGREQHRLADDVAVDELRERGRHVLDGVVLAQREGRAAVVHAEQ
jgi:hypothetical protein